MSQTVDFAGRLNGVMSSPSLPERESPSCKVAVNSYRDSDGHIRSFAQIVRIMKSALPEDAKITKGAKECMQECVSEFISFIASEGAWRNSSSL